MTVIEARTVEVVDSVDTEEAKPLEPIGAGNEFHHEEGEANRQQALALGGIVSMASKVQYNADDCLITGTAVIVF